MKRIFHLVMLFLFLISIPSMLHAGARPDTSVSLKKGDRIIFLGDSITQQGTGSNGFVTIIKDHLADKYPNLEIEVIGAGVSGNKAPDLLKRVDKDVIARKPTIVVINIGVYDIWQGQTDPKKGTASGQFEIALREVVNKIKKAGAKVVVRTPTVIGEKPGRANKPDAQLDEYAEISRNVARNSEQAICDLRVAFIDYLGTHNRSDKTSGILTTDGVHLSAAGNKLVAETLLKGFSRK